MHNKKVRRKAWRSRVAKCRAYILRATTFNATSHTICARGLHKTMPERQFRALWRHQVLFFDGTPLAGVDIHRWLGVLWPSDLDLTAFLMLRIRLASAALFQLAGFASSLPWMMLRELFESKVDSILDFGQDLSPNSLFELGFLTRPRGRELTSRSTFDPEVKI